MQPPPPQFIIVQQPQKSLGCLSCIGGIVVAVVLLFVGLMVIGALTR